MHNCQSTFYGATLNRPNIYAAVFFLICGTSNAASVPIQAFYMESYDTSKSIAKENSRLRLS